MAALDTHLATALDRIDGRGERRRLRAAAIAADGRLVRDGRTLIDASRDRKSVV